MDKNELNFNEINTKRLKTIAANIRKNIVDTVYYANSGHPGGSLSCTDILTVLYFKHMRIKEKEPKWVDRDRFVLSKGHCSPGLYSTLAQRGFFDIDDLKTFRKTQSNLEGHPNMNYVPGVDMSTGSLGQGISVACGMALAGKIDKKDYRVFAILGDGEIEEGQVWEALMSAAHYKLDNLTIFLDNNGLQIDGRIDEVMSPYPIVDKLKAFGQNVIEIDGNDIEEIDDAINQAKKVKGCPTVIVAKTIKGKGVSFMEDQVGWHGKAPSLEQRDIAIKELDKILSSLEE